MKKYILVPFKEYQEREKVQHWKRGNSASRVIREKSDEIKGTDEVGVAVQQRPRTKKRKKSREEITGSQVSGYQPPGIANRSDSFAFKKKSLPEEEREEEYRSDKEEVEDGPLENGYSGTTTRKFWIRP